MTTTDIEKKLVPKDALEVELLDRGWISPDRVKFDKDCIRDSKGIKKRDQPRFVYRRGNFRAITPIGERPWWTIQKVIDGNVVWYVDFPTTVNISAIMAFIAES